MNKMTTELIELPELTDTAALQAFNSPDGLQEIINNTRKVVEDFKHDLSTDIGRKKTASLAYKVAKIISKLDASRKNLLSDWAKKTKVVNSNWKDAKEDLRDIQEEARKSLDAWEVEQKKIAAEKQAQEEAEKLAKEVDADHELALLQYDQFLRELEAETIRLNNERIAEEKRLEDERIANEKRIADEATARATAAAEKKAEDARIEAERLFMELELAAQREAEAERAKIEREKLKAQRAEVAAKEAKQRAIEAKKAAEQTAKDAIDKAKEDAERAKQEEIARQRKAEADAKEADRLAIKRQQEADQAVIDAQAKADERAEAAAAQAKQDELDRQAKEKADAQAEQERREANKRHVGGIRKQAKESLMKFVDEKTAKAIVMAIHAGDIENVTINY